MFPSNVNNVACPGCQPSDFPGPHICGAGVTITTAGGSVNSNAYQCSVCGMTVWMGQYHACGGTPTYPIQGAARQACEHCWCGDGGIQNGKPHDACCMCDTRRVKV